MPSQPVPRRGRIVPSPGPELLRRSHGALSAGGSRRVPRTAPQRSPRTASLGRRVGTPKGPRSQGHQAFAGHEAERAPGAAALLHLPLSHPPTSPSPPFLSLSCVPTSISCPIHLGSLPFQALPRCLPVPALVSLHPDLRHTETLTQAAVGPTPHTSCPVNLLFSQPKVLPSSTPHLWSQHGLGKGQVLDLASEETEEPPGLISPSVK